MPKLEPGTRLTTIEQAMIDRISGKRPEAGPEWQGPGAPLKPLAPEKVKGRAFDYGTSWNLNPRPRSEFNAQGSAAAIDFATLQRIADPTRGGLDLLRLAIETRKDQMAAQKWDIVPRDKKSKDRKRAEEVRRLLRFPDGVTMFAPWQRSLLEDRLVIDAATIYPRPIGNNEFLPEVVDGSTIKRLLAEDGRVPLPPLPAFQQNLKGMAAADFTMDELIYAPFNITPSRVYALSPTEQVVNIVNLGLRRMLSQTAYYTHGNMPDALIVAPEDWDADQVKDFQNHWNSVLEGNVEMRRNGRWVPYGTDVKNVITTDLQDPIDEWLARVICWAFSLPPSALVKEVNRATSEQSANTGKEEGLEPLKNWWKDLMDVVLERCYGAPDLEWAWKTEEVLKPKEKAEIAVALVNAGIITVDEAREEQGREPLTDEQKAELAPPMPEEGLEAPGAGAAGKPGTSQGAAGRDSASGKLPPAKSKDDDTEKLAKVAAMAVELIQKKKSIRPLPRGRAAVRRAEKRVKAAAKAYLVKVRKVLVAGLLAPVEQVGKTDHPTVIQILNSVPAKEREKLQKALAEELGELAEDAAERGLNQLLFVMEPDAADLEAMLSQANAEAIAWAEKRAAELVTQIDETTRDRVRDLVTGAMEDGLSNEALADLIEADGSGLFDEDRALLIARTETAFADVQGNMAGWRQLGVVESVQWIMAQDEVCEDCQSLDGKIVPLGDAFTAESGETTDGPPLHPNCRCALLPVLTNPSEAE